MTEKKRPSYFCPIFRRSSPCGHLPPIQCIESCPKLDGLIAESEAEGRRYLSRFPTSKPTAEIPIALFNEHTPDDHIDFILEPIEKGNDGASCRTRIALHC